MKLHELVGSLIIGKVGGYRLTGNEEQLLRDGTMCGVTLFKENAESVPQLAALIDSICTLRKGAVIAVDQEGGAVQRFDHLLSPLPSQLAAAACPDSNAVEQIAAISSRQLKLLGVNCLLGPVLDICSNASNPIIGSRAFTARAQEAGRLGMKYVKAVLANGVTPVGKHFPGHGDVNVDSHLDIPVLNASREQLFQRELIPFQTCLPLLPALMVGHISVPAIDQGGAPASLSYRITTELLRKQLGFEGVILTDDLTMGAITKHYDLGEAAIKAILAGCDQILAAGDYKSILSVHRALLNAAESGLLSEARLVKSVERIKKAYAVCAAPDGTEKRIAQLRIGPDTQTSLTITRSAIRRLRGDAPNLLAGSWRILVPDHPRYRLELCRHLKQTAAQLPQLNAIEQRFPLDPSSKEIAQIVDNIKNENCILLSFRAKAYGGQLQLAKELAFSDRQLCVIETDLPGLDGIKELKNLYATLDPSEAAIRSLAQLLMSRSI